MTATVSTPYSRLRFGYARADITPPVGIYHRMWGAARHDRATGVHRPLYADVFALAPLTGTGTGSGASGESGLASLSGAPSSPPLIRVFVDLVGLAQARHDALTQAVAEACDFSPTQVVITYSHTHAGGWLVPDREALPGGELIGPYLADLSARLRRAAREALSGMAEATVTYASGSCAMGASRDYWDERAGSYVCGFNPDTPSDDTLVVARFTGHDGSLLATLVNYACHPTTLAWENTLLSPDFPGALRETVERASGAPCAFMQGACGDRGPRRGYTADPAVADQNGREAGYPALSLLESLGPPLTRYDYQGPVVSGATLGVWGDVVLPPERLAQAAAFAGGSFAVDLPLRARPDPAALRQELAGWEARQRSADEAGDALAARDAAARAERVRRWLGRIADFPPGESYPLRCSVQRLGDAIWVATGGEPYSFVQGELRRRFPQYAILFAPLYGDMQVAYLLTHASYGKGLYQEEPSILAPGCLEQLTDALAERVASLVA
jgi:hypothetical protein